MQVAKLGTPHKGAAFLAELKRRLFMEGFVVAVPEPDIGDDLWVADIGRNGSIHGRDIMINSDTRLFRCQVKSAASVKRVSGDCVEYTVNFTKASMKNLRCRFYYLIGLYRPNSADANIHIGCFPSAFFNRLRKKGKLRFNKAGRCILDFFVRKTGRKTEYSLRLKFKPRTGKKYGKGPPEPVNAFFGVSGGLRKAFKRCDT